MNHSSCSLTRLWQPFDELLLAAPVRVAVLHMQKSEMCSSSSLAYHTIFRARANLVTRMARSITEKTFKAEIVIDSHGKCKVFSGDFFPESG